MLTAIAYSLPLAIGVLLSSMPLTVVPVMLLTRPGKGAVLAFLAGWVGGFLLVGSVVLVLVDVITPNPEGPPAWLQWIRIVLGFLLLWLAWTQWRGRPRAGVDAVLPGWMSRIDALTTTGAAGLGLLLASVNPKYTVLIASGALSIASVTYAPAAQWGALVVFTAVSSAGVFTPLLVSWLLGQRARAPLENFKAWMVQNNAVIMAMVLAALGLVVMANGITALR